MSRARDGLDAGPRRQACCRVPHRRRQHRRRRCLALEELEAGEDEPVRVETDVERADIAEALDEERRTDQEGHGEGRLEDHQPGPESRAVPHAIA
jgi:hypothetical protein